MWKIGYYPMGSTVVMSAYNTILQRRKSKIGILVIDLVMSYKLALSK